MYLEGSYSISSGSGACNSLLRDPAVPAQRFLQFPEFSSTSTRYLRNTRSPASGAHAQETELRQTNSGNQALETNSEGLNSENQAQEIKLRKSSSGNQKEETKLKKPRAGS